MKKKLTSLLGIVFALLLPACIEFETEVTVNKDGSGTITEEVILSAQMVGMMEMAAAQGGGDQNPFADMKDEGKAKERAKEFGEGVTFVKLEEIKNDNGGKGVRMVFKFEDINKITLSPMGGMSDMAGAPGEVEEEEEKATFKFADGTLTVMLPQPEGGGEGEAEEAEEFDPNDPEAAMAAQMLKGMKMTAKITMAEGIAKTDATHQDGDSVTLFEIKMDEIMKNPKGLGAFKGLENKGPAAAAEAMKDIKGAKVETKEKISITSK